MAVVKILKFAPLSLRKWIEEDQGSALLDWTLRNGYVNITVITTGKNIKQINGNFSDYIIRAPLSTMTFFQVLNQMEKVFTSNTSMKEIVDLYDTALNTTTNTRDIVLCGRLVIGKDDDGVNYLALLKEGKPKIKFLLMPNNKYVKYRDEHEKEITDSKELSSIFAKSYLKAMQRLFIPELSKSVITESEYQSGLTHNQKPEEPTLGESLTDIII